MKFKVFLAMILAVGLLAACVADDGDNGKDEGDDVVTAASFVEKAEDLQLASSKDGTWIIIPTTDITLEDNLTVSGTFYNGDDEDGDIYRKLAAYDQDDDRNVTAQHTITTPKLVVESENLNFQGGTLNGDVYVDAEGFQLHETATITGDLTFANADYEASADISGTVEGQTTVEE